jgi:hypothetical protein
VWKLCDQRLLAKKALGQMSGQRIAATQRNTIEHVFRSETEQFQYEPVCKVPGFGLFQIGT